MRKRISLRIWLAIRRLRGACIGVAVMVLAAAPANAALNVTFRVPDEGLKPLVVKASLVNQQSSLDNTQVQEVLAAALADYTRLTQVLYANGNYNGTVSILLNGREAAEISFLEPLKSIQKIEINVDPGPIFRFGTLTIAPMPAEVTLPDTFVSGQVARIATLKQAVANVTAGWRALGHAQVAIADQQVIVDHARHVVDVDIRVDPGAQFRIGQLLLETPSDVDLARIRQIAGLDAETLVTPEALQTAAERLRRTEAFASVVLSEADTPNPDGTLNVLARTTDAPLRRLGAGAEVASLSGLTLTGYWMHRNLLGGAENIRVTGKTSGITQALDGVDYTLSTRFERPAAFGADTRFFAYGDVALKDEPSYLAKETTLGVGASKTFSPTLDAEIALALQASRATDSLGTRDLLTLNLPGQVTWDRRDNRFDPRSGLFLHGEVAPFFRLSDLDPGARLFLDARSYRAIDTGLPLVLAARAQAGSLLGADVTTSHPDQLFYSGGGNTVRGQPYQSLGVDDGSGNTIGGQSFLAVSAEMRLAVTDTLGLVGFVDAGSVGSNALWSASDTWHAGAGVGLRYQTGIGPIRFDLAAPIAGDTGQGLQFYIGIGQAF